MYESKQRAATAVPACFNLFFLHNSIVDLAVTRSPLWTTLADKTEDEILQFLICANRSSKMAETQDALANKWRWRRMENIYQSISSPPLKSSPKDS